MMKKTSWEYFIETFIELAKIDKDYCHLLKDGLTYYLDDIVGVKKLFDERPDYLKNHTEAAMFIVTTYNKCYNKEDTPIDIDDIGFD